MKPQRKEMCICLVWLHGTEISHLRTYSSTMVYSLLRFKFYFLLYPLELSMANTKERNASVGDSIAKAKSGLGKGGQNRISGFEVARWLHTTIGLTRRIQQCWCQFDIRIVLFDALVQVASLNLDSFRRNPNVESTSHCSSSEARLWSSIRRPEYGPEPELAFESFRSGCSD